MEQQTTNSQKGITAAVIVAALGYFVDIYDLLLFSIIRIPSLQEIGYSGYALMEKGAFLLNIQMIGLLIGGVFWGILGDKRGRLSVLFGSIFIYSVANIANGFVHSFESYAFWRLIAGFGLAGELGAGITLVSELVSKEKRGYATTLVASIGVSGAVAAYFVADYFDWRTAFFIGGGLGICLLLLRLKVSESSVFKRLENNEVSRGNFLSLFRSRTKFFRYLRCIVIGVPLWFIVGILITFSPEFAMILGVKGKVDAGIAVACCYGGLVLGDIASGLLSQWLKSRLKVVYVFLCLSAVTMFLYFFVTNLSLTSFYIICLAMGFSVGYWVIFMTIAAEQFGTNIRATVTTTVPNFVRGAVVPLSLLFQYLNVLFHQGFVEAGVIIGVFCLAMAFWSLSYMKETFARDMNFTE